MAVQLPPPAAPSQAPGSAGSGEGRKRQEREKKKKRESWHSQISACLSFCGSLFFHEGKLPLVIWSRLGSSGIQFHGSICHELAYASTQHRNGPLSENGDIRACTHANPHAHTAPAPSQTNASKPTGSSGSAQTISPAGMPKVTSMFLYDIKTVCNV
jgi:hypothetical protein